ncbi:PREDICTED: uncharacterized protein LOC105561038 [Vollenhovia emeryi]|uniref:uncharacterized protein LOC105561038 n=1 Tax=Vollenhovia emeryi TaxID=411798 RepID=UPI0005F3A22E|nr:PREDICTED: uncharacterized protein LOC105561038 [Vollenhovia emeryi]XP_011866068.1 PREDICTED: uncharacterized protein LOC105561038 [Vollenhovia emeryi]XP_011866069.1 PREDICTED: uncharacterized protein LOC105561038 [Vollenhovia emeryi]
MPNIVLNLDYLRSWNATFKILQLLLGTICVGIIGNDFNQEKTYSYSTLTFYLVVTCAFYINTCLLFVSYLISSSASSVIPKTIYEFLYHTIASVLLLSASIAMMVHIHKGSTAYASSYEALLVGSIFSLLNTILYICSAVVGYGSYGDD